MKFIAVIIPLALALATTANPIDLYGRQTPPPAPMCNLPGCLLGIASRIPGFIAPCEGAAMNLQAIQQSQSQGQQPSQANQFGLVANGAQCVALTIAAGFGIPQACLGCPGAPPSM